LFGVREPDCFGHIDAATGHSVLYIPRLPPAYAVWMGQILPPAHFKVMPVTVITMTVNLTVCCYTCTDRVALFVLGSVVWKYYTTCEFGMLTTADAAVALCCCRKPMV
jgi:Aminopeptidase P, N-terminal domain